MRPVKICRQSRDTFKLYLETNQESNKQKISRINLAPFGGESRKSEAWFFKFGLEIHFMALFHSDEHKNK